jgi:hypothetical protein
VFFCADRESGESALDEERSEFFAVDFRKYRNRSAKPALVIHIFSPFRR